MENKETLRKILFFSLESKLFKIRVSSRLSIGSQEFKRCVMDVCGAHMKNSRDAARESRYLTSDLLNPRSGSGHFLLGSEFGHILNFKKDSEPDPIGL